MQTDSSEMTTETSGGTDADVFDAIESIGSNTAENFVWAAVIITGSVVLASIVRQTVARLINGDELVGDLVGRLASYTIVSFGFVYALDRLGVSIGPVLGALGVIGIAAAFALQAVLENFVAGLLLQIRRPFAKGDEIETNEYAGTVVSIDSRTMTIHTYDGEIVRLPNATVISDPIVNISTTGRLRSTVSVGVAYGTDLARARAVALEAVRQVDGVLGSPNASVVATGFGDSSLDLECRYWHDGSVAERIRTRDGVVVAVNEAFSRAGIEIPFPQRVVRVAGERDRTDVDALLAGARPG